MQDIRVVSGGLTRLRRQNDGGKLMSSSSPGSGSLGRTDRIVRLANMGRRVSEFGPVSVGDGVKGYFTAVHEDGRPLRSVSTGALFGCISCTQHVSPPTHHERISQWQMLRPRFSTASRRAQRRAVIVTDSADLQRATKLGYLEGLMDVGSVGGWRMIHGAAIPITEVLRFGVCWLPPSPRWLLLRDLQGKSTMTHAKERAKESLSRLRGPDVGKPRIEIELDETVIYGQNVTFSGLLEGNLNRKAMIIEGDLIFFQQVTGQPSMLYLAAKILQCSVDLPLSKMIIAISVIWRQLPCLDLLKQVR